MANLKTGAQIVAIAGAGLLIANAPDIYSAPNKLPQKQQNEIIRLYGNAGNNFGVGTTNRQAASPFAGAFSSAGINRKELLEKALMADSTLHNIVEQMVEPQYEIERRAVWFREMSKDAAGPLKEFLAFLSVQGISLHGFNPQDESNPGVWPYLDSASGRMVRPEGWKTLTRDNFYVLMNYINGADSVQNGAHIKELKDFLTGAIAQGGEKKPYEHFDAFVEYLAGRGIISEPAIDYWPCSKLQGTSQGLPGYGNSSADTSAELKELYSLLDSRGIYLHPYLNIDTTRHLRGSSLPDTVENGFTYGLWGEWIEVDSNGHIGRSLFEGWKSLTLENYKRLEQYLKSPKNLRKFTNFVEQAAWEHPQDVFYVEDYGGTLVKRVSNADLYNAITRWLGKRGVIKEPFDVFNPMPYLY